jgi:tetrahydromethanopterin S-methyltransferase subunit B
VKQEDHLQAIKMMTYMQMLPIVAEITAAWKVHDAPTSSFEQRAAATAKIAELTARLPPKESVPHTAILESAADYYAAMMPVSRRIKELEAQETTLLDGLDELKKASTVKWGPKKTASGETQESLRKKLAPLTTELDKLEEYVKKLDEHLTPLIEDLKWIDQNNRNRAEVAAWVARGKTGAVPGCIVTRAREDAAEFLATSVVLPFPSAYARSVVKASLKAQ